MLGLGFSPTSVASILGSASVLPPAYPAEGLRLWVDATELSTITKDGSDLVSAWASRYGSASFTSSGADRPTYQAAGMDGNPAIDFTGSDVMNVNSLASLFSGDDTPMAAFMVCEMDTLQNNDLLVWGNSADADSLMILRQTATQYAYIKREDAGGSAIGPIGGTTDTTPHVFSFRTNAAGTSATTRLDGADLNTASIDVGQTTVDVLALGARDSNGVVSTYTNGRIGEVLIYDRYVTDGEAAAIHTYLINKWGTNRVFFTGADSTLALTNSLTATQSILLSGTVASVAITNSCNATQAVNFTGADATVAMTNSCNATQVTPAVDGTMDFESTSSQTLSIGARDLFDTTNSTITVTKFAIAFTIGFETADSVRGIFGPPTGAGVTNAIEVAVQRYSVNDAVQINFRHNGTEYGQNGSIIETVGANTPIYVAIAYDGTQASSVDRVKVYMNGDTGTSVGGGSVPTSLTVNTGVSDDYNLGNNDTEDGFFDGTMKTPAIFLNQDFPASSVWTGSAQASASTMAGLTGCISAISASSNVNDDEVIGVSAWTNNNGVSIV